MSCSPTEVRPALALGVTLSADSLVVDLADGRTVSAPLAWYPRLVHGSPSERGNWRFIGAGKAFTGQILMKTSALTTC
jgi:hypothetical protein